MPKLTKAQRRELEGILGHLVRAGGYLKSPTTSVARRTRGPATDILTFSRPTVPESFRMRGAPPENYCLYEVNIDIGSDLTGLWQAERDLRLILERS